MNDDDDISYISVLCIFCFRRYNRTKFQPKLLSCGHSCCSVCVEAIIKLKNSYCPVCNYRLYITDASKLETNEALLDTAADLLFPFENKQNFNFIVNTVIEKLKSCGASLNEVDLMVSRFQIPQNNLKYQTHFTQIISLIYNILSKIHIIQDYVIPDGQSRLLPIIASTPDKFLLQLTSLLSEGAEMYTATHIKNQIKFGKINLIGNGILVNSMSLPEMKLGSKYYLLDDIKFMFSNSICPFFTFSYNEDTADCDPLIFDILPVHRASLVELCTGEATCTFKNSSCEFIAGDRYLLDLITDTNMKLKKSGKKLILNEHDIILYFHSVKPVQFAIKEVKELKHLNVPRNQIIGKLVNGNHIEFLRRSKIEKSIIKECGFAVFKYPLSNS